ncbi:hypothetical protein F0P96_05025 [Hymenobacter busanensis]|uniref:Uncharacterized protein n=1 Tax=Hymenobacter busanensis TaxID=2607656 RepID=A0A7L5A2T4_9BACT|nr:hypothetical protein [Hymenobacter busanensis]KAA9338211.1 hypothetical protein F0P96_05025 [Hymenobacter busanensis]QHJ09365.1 hypothetical protein GUY19_19585 [Hymenobacter busanensis]
MRKPAEIISSPSGEYSLKIDLNKDKTARTKYDCILLTLYDKEGKEITKLQTGASNNMKWAVGWYSNKDTIIVNSKDIGTHAYHLTDKKQLDTLTITQDINSIAENLLNKKYAGR